MNITIALTTFQAITVLITSIYSQAVRLNFCYPYVIACDKFQYTTDENYFRMENSRDYSWSPL